MAYKTPEDLVKDKILKYLIPMDYKHGGTLIICRRDATGINYKKGIPDLFVIKGPLHIEIECKAKNGKLSAMQEEWQKIFARTHTPYIKANSFEEFLEQWEKIAR